MSNIFRADDSCSHQISNALLIGSVAFLIAAPPLSVPRPEGLQSPEPYSTLALRPQYVYCTTHGFIRIICTQTTMSRHFLFSSLSSCLEINAKRSTCCCPGSQILFSFILRTLLLRFTYVFHQTVSTAENEQVGLAVTLKTCTLFESGPCYRLYWVRGFMFFLSLSRRMQEQFLETGCYCLLPIHHHLPTSLVKKIVNLCSWNSVVK
jgi:hypothetical protein